MSNMAQPDEIDALVSSVRNLVAHRDAGKIARAAAPERLVLTPALRVDTIAPVQVVADEPAPDLEQTAAEIEKAVLSQPGEWEADGGESIDQDAWAASAFPSETDGDADASDVAAQDVEAETPVAPDALPLDEDALRALIVTVLREELAGELGEKVTQNVRKMVRREISRVMTTHQRD